MRIFITMTITVVIIIITVIIIISITEVVVLLNYVSNQANRLLELSATII